MQLRIIFDKALEGMLIKSFLTREAYEWRSPCALA